MAEQQPKPIVLVVDDDASMRQALARLFRSVDLEAEAFGSTADMLRHDFPDVPSCLVLDVRLPGLSGVDFQARRASIMPTITSGNTNAPTITITEKAADILCADKGTDRVANSTSA